MMPHLSSGTVRRIVVWASLGVALELWRRATRSSRTTAVTINQPGISSRVMPKLAKADEKVSKAQTKIAEAKAKGIDTTKAEEAVRDVQAKVAQAQRV